MLFVVVIAFLAACAVISILASVSSWIENERMRKDPTYIPNKNGILPFLRKNR